jgi:hypothetical protein
LAERKADGSWTDATTNRAIRFAHASDFQVEAFRDFKLPNPFLDSISSFDVLLFALDQFVDVLLQVLLD